MEFGSFLNRTIPHFNYLTRRDFSHVVQINFTENYSVIIVVSVITGLYFIILGILFVLNRIKPCKMQTNYQVSKPRGKFRALLYDFSQAHLYVSFFYIDERIHYTRTRRLACILIAVTTCLAANGFSYSDGKGSNTLKWIIASIVCNVLQAPFVGFFRWLFSNTAPRNLSNNEYMMTQTISREFDDAELSLNVDIIENQIDISDHDPEFQESTSKSLLTKFLDICDELCGTLVTRFETTEVTWEAVFSLLLISVLYFGILIAGLYLLPLTFNYITTLHQCILLVLFVVFFFGHLEYLYLKLRIRKYKEGTLKTWKVSPTNITVSCIILAILFVIIVQTILLSHYIPFIIPFSAIIIHEYINAAVWALILVFLLRVIGLALSIKMPGLKREQNIEYNVEQSTAPKYTFPWWMIYINYVLCFIFIALMIFFTLAYGVHFDKRGETQNWLLASFIGLSFYIFVRFPVTHLFMYVLYGWFVKTMEASLFPRSDLYFTLHLCDENNTEVQLDEIAPRNSLDEEEITAPSEQQEITPSSSPF
jgi:hypothetical protein